ncbi:hypothetical protein Bbelb_240150 [Branchiostoma belcheri]|nr:hypothetical protein Bbelb_240150 [Branchiostoma belcheri]
MPPTGDLCAGIAFLFCPLKSDYCEILETKLYLSCTHLCTHMCCPTDGVISGIVSLDLSFCTPTLEAQPSRPLDMSALTWLLTHDSAIRSLRLHNCQLYTEELVAVFNAISESPDSCKLEMLDVSFNNYRSEKGSGALAQLITKSRLTCLKMEVVSSISAGGLPIVTPEVVLALRRNTRLQELWLSGNRLGDAGVEALMQVFAPGGNSCLQVLALRLVGHVDTGLPAFMDSAALMVEHVAQM